MLAVRQGIPVPCSILGVEAVEAVEVSADPAAAGLRVGPGGSCRRRAGARLAPGSLRHSCGAASLRRCDLNGGGKIGKRI